MDQRVGNLPFQNALARQPQAVPPIWMMRQAGRYHQHYQALKEKYTFMQLCKEPELAAEVALGPVAEFDFDVAILFSDLLFPLEALGMGLRYDPGPILDRELTTEDLPNLTPLEPAVQALQFQKKAVQLTRERLPSNKSLIGFVGGPWTLFCYAVGCGHDGNLIKAKRQLDFYNKYCEVMMPLLKKNIQLQLEGGAEVVMIFDTAAGELSPSIFDQCVAPGIEELAKAYPHQVGYYSKGTQSAHLKKSIFTSSDLAGVGVDHRWALSDVLSQRVTGFTQGNFDQALLFLDSTDFKGALLKWLKPIKDLTPEQRRGWVCGLGHGILPKTPEENVRDFVQIVRRELGGL